MCDREMTRVELIDETVRLRADNARLRDGIKRLLYRMDSFENQPIYFKTREAIENLREIIMEEQ
jgi:hypothetical protein